MEYRGRGQVRLYPVFWNPDGSAGQAEGGTVGLWELVFPRRCGGGGKFWRCVKREWNTGGRGRGVVGEWWSE